MGLWMELEQIDFAAKAEAEVIEFPNEVERLLRSAETLRHRIRDGGISASTK